MPADLRDCILKPYGVIHLWVSQTATFEYFQADFCFASYRVFGMLSTTLHGTLSQSLYPFAQWGSEVLKVDRF
jgi:hypothetical protein